MDLIRIICAILLPPLGVFLQVGFGAQFWLNILLTLLGYGARHRARHLGHRTALRAAGRGRSAPRRARVAATNARRGRSWR